MADGSKDGDRAGAPQAIAFEDRTAHILRYVARGLRRGLEYRLSEQGVSFGHWVFLRILWREEPLSQRELSARAGLMEPTTHAAILKMERAGLVERRAAPGRRRTRVHLTEAGRALEGVLTPLAEEVNDVALSGASAEEVATFRRLLRLMAENLATDEARALKNGRRILPTRPQGD